MTRHEKIAHVATVRLCLALHLRADVPAEIKARAAELAREATSVVVANDPLPE